MSPEVEALVKKIGEQGDKVRQLKSSGAEKVYTDTAWNPAFIFVKIFILDNMDSFKILVCKVFLVLLERCCISSRRVKMLQLMKSHNDIVQNFTHLHPPKGEYAI